MTSAGYRCISYLTDIVFGTELLNWPCLGFLYVRGIRDDVQPVATLAVLRFYAPWAKGGFSNSTIFSLPRSRTAVALSKRSLGLLLRLCLRDGVASGSLKSRHACLVDTYLFRRRELAGVVGGELLFILSPSVTNSCWGGVC